MKRTWHISQGMARQVVQQVVQEGAFGKQAVLFWEPKGGSILLRGCQDDL